MKAATAVLMWGIMTGRMSWRKGYGVEASGEAYEPQAFRKST